MNSIKRYTFCFLLILLFAGCDNSKETPYSLVDPFIGTGGHGHTYPGAAFPFGMVQLSPDTRQDSWDGCSGYHHSDTAILGFSHTHLSGTGVGDYGDIRFMPVTNPALVMEGAGYASTFRHETETAEPGYYRVRLDDPGVNVELTVGLRAGLHRYTYPADSSAFVIIDLSESVTSDRILESGIYRIDDHTVAGFRRTDGWADDQYIFFYAEFSQPLEELVIYQDRLPGDNDERAEGTNIVALAGFGIPDRNQLLVRIGISAVDTAGARDNLEKSLEGWNFEKTRKVAKEAWSRELSRIMVEGGSKEDRTTFYTALYHAFLAPNLFSDADGRYRGHDKKIHQPEEGEVYTVFSLWDTYRAAHPLYNLILPERNQEFIRSMLKIYEDGGLLPVWELAGNETFCMIGYHSVPVIADAYIKGNRDFDADLALKAMVHSASRDHFGLKEYREHGYIPADKEGESVSKTLEYAYDDWCIAQMAREMGRDGIYKEYIRRAQYYKNLFDPVTRFIRGKKNGMFTEPFDPSEVNFMLTEANTWQYTFYVPQDIDGLIGWMGGKEAFGQKLDELFNAPVGLAGRVQPDITGLIGQYAHGNEPSHHMAYLYNYCEQPQKTQRLVRRIMREMYHDRPDGLCGNEDCGQMSAWYVFSAMGFYPVTPGSDVYAIGSPLFDRVVIHLENGKKFTVTAHGNAEDRIYIDSARLNKVVHDRSFLVHSEITSGGELELSMLARPGDRWGKGEGNFPSSRIDEHLITAVPFVRAPSSVFSKEISVRAGHLQDDVVIRYSMGKGNRVSALSPQFPDSLVLARSAVVNLRAYPEGGIPGKEVTSEFFRIPHQYAVKTKYPYSRQYSGGGEMALVDMQRGGDNFRTGAWQGYQGVDLEVMIDLGGNRKISAITATFLEDQDSWIFFPEEVVIEASKRPYDFKTLAIIRNRYPERSGKPAIQDFRKPKLRTSARYVRVKAKNRGVCPEWHKAAGYPAWIFIDEISIE